MTVLMRDGPFTQTTRHPACRVGPHPAGPDRSSGPARRSAAPPGAEQPLPPTPSPQAPQPTATGWPLTVLQATNSARRSVAIQQPPQLIALRGRVGGVLGHLRSCGRQPGGRPPAWRLGASGGRRCRASEAGLIGARAGTGRPVGVLPPIPRYGQYRRNLSKDLATALTIGQACLVVAQPCDAAGSATLASDTGSGHVQASWPGGRGRRRRNGAGLYG
jgi:hypothetical protein